jgi:uncharacterized heparinase superfamily protein
VGILLGGLRKVLHPDGQIALFNDSAFGIVAPPSSLSALAAGLGATAAGRDAADLPATGYFRFDDDGDALLFDAGLLGPDHLPGHAHCDALSFEYSIGRRRVVVDTGVDRYEAGRERDFLRSTAAHSTLQIADLEQGEPFGSFRMGRRPRVTGRRVDDRTVEGEHDGFRPSGIHRRRVVWEGCRGFSWTDCVQGEELVDVTVRLGLAPGLQVAVDRSRATVDGPGGIRFELSGPEDGGLHVTEGPYCERFGSRTPRPVVCWRGPAGRGIELPFSVRTVGR